MGVRPRGVFRRAHCKYPPLRLNFRKSDVPGTLLAGQDKLKLVTPCAGSGNDGQRLALEYHAYRLYALLEPAYSFRTRLLRIDYVDSENRVAPRQELGFVIESHANLAARTGGRVHEPERQSMADIDAALAARVELFQYLLGNTDFSLVAAAPGRTCCHNIKLLQPAAANTPVVPVPYDFDSSGLIDAPYARPSPQVPIRSVKKRFFMGRCRNPALMREAHADILAKMPAMRAEISDSPWLNATQKRKALKYLNAFFDRIDTPEAAERRVFSKCRG